MKRFLILILMGIGSTLSAQDAAKAKPSGMEVNLNVGITRVITSSMFRVAFKGLYEGNVSFAGRLFDKFYLGAGYQNTFLNSNRNVFIYYPVPTPTPKAGATLSYNTNLMVNSGYLRFSYQTYFSEIGHVKYALNAGYSYCTYLNVISDSLPANLPRVSKSFLAPYLQPEVSLNFVAEEHLSFAVFLSYTTMFYHFNPKAPQLNQFEELRAERNNYLISWINLGFGVTIMLNKRK